MVRNTRTFVHQETQVDVVKPTKCTLKKCRVQLDFAPKSMTRLNILKEKTESTSYVEVVKNALQLYEALIEETEKGTVFLTRDKNGAIAPFRMFV